MDKTELKVYAMCSCLVLFECDNKIAYATAKEWLDSANIDYKEWGKSTKRIRIHKMLTLDALCLLSETFKIVVE